MRAENALVLPPPDLPDFEIQRRISLEIPLELPEEEQPPPPTPAEPDRPSDPFLRR